MDCLAKAHGQVSPRNREDLRKTKESSGNLLPITGPSSYKKQNSVHPKEIRKQKEIQLSYLNTLVLTLWKTYLIVDPVNQHAREWAQDW